MAAFTSYNPRTGGVIGTYPVACEEDVSCAIERARQMSPAWAAQTPAERITALRRLRDSVAADAGGLADIVCAEIGKPLQDTLGADLLALVTALDWLIKNASGLLKPRRIAGERNAQLQPMPYGVVGVIGTWNYPLLLDGTTLAWAAAAGNAVVWKPSELATASATALYQHCERAGLPVVLITGDSAAGRALCRMPIDEIDKDKVDDKIDKLAFTGGVATGRMIQAQLAGRGIPSVMELSGNDALIACADLAGKSLEAAARAAVWARICNAGQSCVSPQRIIVVRPAYEPFVHACHQIMAGLRAGVDYGPLRTDAFRVRAHDLVSEAVGQGANLRLGGHCLNASAFADGFYYAPTLLTDCWPDMNVMRQDFFGPVLCISAAQNEEEAITQANNDDMGLGASIWTQDIGKGKRIAARLRAGVVTINMETLLTGAHPGLPFGGMGASGWGRQRGAAGLDEFVQWKTVCWQRSAGAQRHVFPYRGATLPILHGLIALQTAQGVRAKVQALRDLTNAARKWNGDTPHL